MLTEWQNLETALVSIKSRMAIHVADSLHVIPHRAKRVKNSYVEIKG